MKRFLQSCLATTVLLLSSACSSHNDKDMRSMNPFKSLQTQCVARVLIDLPLGKGAWAATMADTNKVTRLQVPDRQAFDAVVAARVAELKSKPHRTEPTLLSKEVREQDKGVLLLHRYGDDIDFAYEMERYLWPTGYKLVGPSIENDKAQNLSSHSSIFRKLQPRPPTAIPTQPGFCIDGAIITEPLADEFGTSVDLSVTPAGWPGVSLGLVVEEHQRDLGKDAFAALANEESTAKPRAQFERTALKAFRVIRKRDRPLAGYPGQEAVSLIEFEDGRKLYSFRWRTLGKLRSYAHPHITITMDTDKPSVDGGHAKVPPEDQLLGLWDAVLESLRQRPNALPAGLP